MRRRIDHHHIHLRGDGILTLSDLKSYWVSVDGVQTGDVCIPADLDLNSNQRIVIESIDYFVWFNAITNYLVVAYDYYGDNIRLLALKSSGNTGTQIAGTKVLKTALPWGYKFVIAWGMTLASHHASCAVLYRIETQDEEPNVEEGRPLASASCPYLGQIMGNCRSVEAWQ